jgi:hypothetical protein
MSDLNPEPYRLDDFDEITSDVPMISAFRALWNEAEELLQATRPEGFLPEEIGRLAFEELTAKLPERERKTAMDELFYTFWVVIVEDRERRASQAGGAL